MDSSPTANRNSSQIRLPAIAIGLAALSAIASACCHRQPPPAPSAGTATHHAQESHAEPEAIPPHGTPAWNRIVESRLHITDSAGHGPDIGSDEWMGAVTKKSGISTTLKPGSEAWYRAVDARVFRSH